MSYVLENGLLGLLYEVPCRVWASVVCSPSSWHFVRLCIWGQFVELIVRWWLIEYSSSGVVGSSMCLLYIKFCLGLIFAEVFL
jgi:hypothetical protein